jgi:predicted NUDIX family NTP pyrophosphohydrolase
MIVSFYNRGMGRYEVEMMRDGKTIRRAEVRAGSDVEAANVWGSVIVPTGREPTSGEWLRVTQVSRTSWFQIDRTNSLIL